MKILLTLILLAVTVRAAPMSAEAAKLLAELPPQRVLREAQDLFVIPEGSDRSQVEAKYPGQLVDAQKVIAKAQEIVPRLRKLIEVGSSVFDYPGLLGRGDIAWHEYANEYELYLGVYLRAQEGRGEYDFKITFDVKGVITGVKSVVWKH